MKHAVKVFLSEKLYAGEITLSRLSAILKALGFHIVPFSRDSNIVDGLSALSLTEHIKNYECFTYMRKHKYVFIYKGLSDRDKSICLLHELGHICLGHLISSDGVFESKISKELQAHAFCLTVLFLNHIVRFFKPIAIFLSIALLFFAVSAEDSTLRHPVPSEPTQAATEQVDLQDPKEETVFADPLTQEIVYWSPGGEVYHLDPSCPHLINAIEIQSGDISQCGKKRCCLTCQKKE